MFEARVAQFYRAKGYEVHENPKVRGTSENVYSVALVADGPLGALLISFGDAGGVDAAEVGRVRTMARDIGATPVVAAPSLPPDVRRLAAQMGVVAVDDAMVTETGPLPTDLPAVDGAKAPGDPLRRDMDAHPWPVSGRSFTLAGPTTTAARDVDELIADLHRPATQAAPAAKPAPPPLVPGSPSATAQVMAPPEQVQAAPVAAAAQATKFSWLGGGAGLLETQPQAQRVAGPVDLGALLGKSQAGPTLEHETTLMARQPPLQRVQEKAVTWFDIMRDWPWKTIVLASSGGGLLILIIRWLA